jgi:Spy/CpxP family protein refolding chaperone
MSKIRSMVLGLLVVAGVASVAEAQEPQGNRDQRPRGEGRRGGKDGVGGRGMRGLFRGIDLSEAEKTSLQAVTQKYSSQLQTIRQSMKPDVEAARAARQRGDTAAARAAFARTADERTQLVALSDRMHAEARAALAPAHRAQFDANVARMKERMANRAKGDGFGERRGRRGEGKRNRSA